MTAMDTERASEELDAAFRELEDAITNKRMAVLTPAWTRTMLQSRRAAQPADRAAIIEECARVAEADHTPAYGSHRDAMEHLASCQRRNIAEAIRALNQEGE